MPAIYKNNGHYVCLPSPLLIRDVLALCSAQMSKLANVSIASEDPHRSKCLVNCFNAGPTISVMPFEGFPCVLKPPVNADLIGYNIGNIVTNHKTAFFCVDQSQGLKSAKREREREGEREGGRDK